MSVEQPPPMRAASDHELDGRVALTLRLRADATSEHGPIGRLHLAQGSKHYSIGPLREGTRPALETLVGSGAEEEALLATAPDDQVRGDLVQVLDRLARRGWLERTLWHGDRCLATLRPLGHRKPMGFSPEPADVVVLSRFAFVRREGDELVLESPRSTARVILHDPSLLVLLSALARARAMADLGGTAGSLPAAATEAAIRLLAQGGMLVPCGTTGDVESTAASLAQWSFPDLVFHSRSRVGRHANGYGATFPLKGRFEPIPDRKPLAGPGLALERPDMAAVLTADPAFTEVLEGRRSLRQHDDEAPITAAQLGELLYRAARVRHDAVWGDGSQRLIGTARPYPTGGARYELELYPVIHRCEGLEPGVYHYDPFDHELGLLAGPGPVVDALLEGARQRGVMEATPQVLLVVTARFGRIMFKYESMSYSTILKNVGALYQTLYCVATAMDLASCALGGGDSDAFCEVAGLDYYEESSVGEFLVGSRLRPSIVQRS